MKKSKLKFPLTLLLITGLMSVCNAQLPSRVLVGYWHTWNQTEAPFIKLKDIDSRYNVINISFVAATDGDVNTLALSYLHTGGGYSQTQLKNDITAARDAGKIVLLSIGGATGSFRLKNTTDQNTFVSKMKTLISNYKVDGIDIDLEVKENVCMSGTIDNPTDPHTTNMIIGLEELLSWYKTTYGKKMILTMTPETVYVTGALSSYQVSNICGGSYLPIIEALKDDIDLITMQLYNSGGMLDLNGVERFQGTEDFIISQTEAVIRGFTAKGELGTYSGIPANKVAVALPACSTAGGGYTSTTKVKNAINYLMGISPKPGNYTLKQNGGYPELRGMMTWSINYDNTTCAGTAKSFAANYESIFSNLSTPVTAASTSGNIKILSSSIEDELQLEVANYAGQPVTIQLVDMNGRTKIMYEQKVASDSENIQIDCKALNPGIYVIQVFSNTRQEAIRIIKQ